MKMCKHSRIPKRLGDPSFHDISDWARITSNLAIDSDTGCWNYCGYLHEAGYGHTSTSKFGTIHEQWVHRIMFTFLRGRIAAGMHVDHTCRNRQCANPLHMEIVTPGVNVMRGVGPCAINITKTHCPRGHEYSGQNLLIRTAKGRQYRACKACDNFNQRERYRLRAEATGRGRHVKGGTRQNI